MEYTDEKHDVEIQGYSMTYIRTCLEKNQDTYIKRFRNLPEHDFNWCAALFGTTWGGYRMMYKYSFLVWAVQWLIITEILAIEMLFGVWRLDYTTAYQFVMITAFLLEIVFFVVRGIYADEFYWRFIKGKIDHELKQSPTQSTFEIEYNLRNHTGVSVGGVILMVIGIDIADALYVSFIMTPLMMMIMLITS